MFEGGEQGSGLDEILSFVESSGDLIEDGVIAVDEKQAA